MPRLPQPGGDNEQWGDILNDFLLVSHTAVGGIKPGTIGTSQLQDLSINSTKLAGGSVTPTKLSGNISKSLLDADVQASLDKADAAGADIVGDATASVKGKVRLAGDIAGSGSSADAPIISNAAITTAKLADDAVTDGKISPTAAIARTKLDSSSQASLTKADTALQIASNLSDLANTVAARSSLGLGTIATRAANEFELAFTIADVVVASGTLSSNQLTPVDAASGTKAMTLPASPAAGTRIGVRKHDSSANTVTITGNINTGTGVTHTLTLLGETITYQADGAGGWWTINGSRTLASLDARFVNASVVTAKGDLLAGTGNATLARLPIGTDNQVLIADASQTTGLRWMTMATGSIMRVIANISTSVAAGAAANTDYVYNATAALTLTLPTAVGNTNSYTIKNSGSANVTIATTSSQTIDGSSTITITAQRAYVLYSDNANWFVT